MPKPITLSASYSDDATIIPNAFFDHYLPRANGEFLKIYLYLLRWLSEMAISDAAAFTALCETAKAKLA